MNTLSTSFSFSHSSTSQAGFTPHYLPEANHDHDTYIPKHTGHLQALILFSLSVACDGGFLSLSWNTFFPWL